MRGKFRDQGALFSYISPEARVPASHPLRLVRRLVREVLKELSRSLGRLYSSEGRPSVPPEQLLSALLLQVFFSRRSERQLLEQLNYNLLFRWFVGLSPDDPVWDATTFTKNRERLQQGYVFEKFMTKLLHHPQVKPLLSDEHFSVDGTLIEAWASELSSQGRQRRRRHTFSRAKPQERHARERHRSRLPPVPKSQWARGQVVVHGRRHHGEPARPGGGGHGHRG
jgi:transposase